MGQLLWISIKHKSLFGSDLICTSNIAEIKDLIFSVDYNSIKIYKDNNLIISSDGLMSLAFDGKNYKGENVAFPKKLCLNSDCLEFDWWPYKSKYISFEDRCDIKHGEYIIKAQNFLFHRALGMTKVKVEVEKTSVNLNLLLACAAFFWLRSDQARIDGEHS